jgi:hypothetical protein
MRVLGLRFPGRRASRRPSYDARRAIVYLHVPKTSGSAVTTGLVSAVAPLRFQPAYDRTGYGSFDGFASMAPEMKQHLYIDIGDLPGGSDFVAGHCAFSTFWTKYSDAQFVSFLREPVSRLLSFWLFWRAYTDDDLVPWGLWGDKMRLSRKSLAEFLRYPELACHTDNLVTRLLLWPDPLIPDDGFIDSRHDAILLRKALLQLERFAYLDVIENPDFVHLLEAWLGRSVTYPRVNETKLTPPLLSMPLHAALTPEALSLLDARSRLDLSLWTMVAERTVAASTPAKLREQTLMRNVARHSALLSSAPKPSLAEMPSSSGAEAPARAEPGRMPDIANRQTLVPEDEVYRSFTPDDVELFRRFVNPAAQAVPDAYVDFLGRITKSRFIYTCAPRVGTVSHDLPIPGDGFYADAIEYTGLLLAIQSVRNGHLVVAELGAGWGPWMAAAGVVARTRGIGKVDLIGIEGSQGKVEHMKDHLADNDLRPRVVDEETSYGNIRCRCIHGIVWRQSGTAQFPVVDPETQFGAAATTGITSRYGVDYRGRTFEYEDLPACRIQDMLGEYPVVDFVHIDIQGTEVEVCRAGIDFLSERVRYLFVGTHSRTIEGELLGLLSQAGFTILREKPCRFDVNARPGTLEARTIADGGQLWRNDRFDQAPA